ncbi:carbohydrate porin [Trinickia dinghuensis]|uniref:Carbohydrate porin n=2 Tax=Trinickia dinghuensis TaxID=2291023 RepID=A0A3D8JUU8_9BURK|nr:carbohydrate porin [Trinickia dinghuensis]RDU96847.1 carbohydrate porin [Trinickia dinghuensis]
MRFSPAVPRAMRKGTHSLTRCAALAWSAFASCAAVAAGSPDALPQAPEADLSIQAQPTNQWTGLSTRQNLLGDMGGLRPWIGKYGMTFQMTETSEYLDNLRGGLAHGGTYDGLTTATLSLDTQKAFGLPGGTFNVSGMQIHGRNLSQYNLGTLNTASGIEADDTTRLWELWYQQSILNGRVDFKVGQQSLDQEFMVSTYANTFINTMFGWAGLPSYDMPSGGPAYPLSALGARVRGQITPSLTALVGVFDGNPAPGVGDPQKLNGSGTNFNLHNGALYIAELQYGVNQPSEGQMDYGTGKPLGGLPGTYKVGFWYNNESFADQRIDNTGLSLANPASSGVAAQHKGDYSFYAVADQMVWRPNPDEPRSIGVFARLMGAPGDRNLVSVSANLGVVMKAPFKGRDNDSVGLALAYIKVGSHAAGLDADSGNVVRGSETAVEATYQYQVTPWWVLQGDAQYTFNAGAGQNPSNPTQTLRNTFVVGARTTITF